MTIFLFFFLSLFNSFSRRISCFQKKLSFIFRPLLCPYHTGFQENLHNFAYPHISPTPVSLSLSLLSIFRILEIRIGEIKSLTFLIRNSRRLTILVQYFRRTKNNIKKSFLNEYYCKFKNSRSLFVIHGSNGLKRESKRKRKKFRGVQNSCLNKIKERRKNAKEENSFCGKSNLERSNFPRTPRIRIPLLVDAIPFSFRYIFFRNTCLEQSQTLLSDYSTVKHLAERIFNYPSLSTRDLTINKFDLAWKICDD